MGETRVAKRHRWRLPCEIVYDGGRQRSFVIDLSASGLFVQTGARLKPGTDVAIRLSLETAARPLVLRARVARAKQVASQLRSVAHGGVGLRLLDPPREYLDALAALDRGTALRAGAETMEKAAAPSVADRYRVRVKQIDGPRMRTIEVEAESPEQARARGKREAGAGFEVLAVDRIAREPAL